MSEHLLFVVVPGACVCAALVAVGLLGAIVNVSGRESDQERERGVEP